MHCPVMHKNPISRGFSREPRNTQWVALMALSAKKNTKITSEKFSLEWLSCSDLSQNLKSKLYTNSQLIKVLTSHLHKTITAPKRSEIKELQPFSECPSRLSKYIWLSYDTYPKLTFTPAHVDRAVGLVVSHFIVRSLQAIVSAIAKIRDRQTDGLFRTSAKKAERLDLGVAGKFLTTAKVCSTQDVR